MKRLMLIAAAIVAIAASVGPAAARLAITPSAILGSTGDATIQVRGHGRGHMGRGGRGHHYGWGRGRGHHYGWGRGRGHHYGWRHHRWH